MSGTPANPPRDRSCTILPYFTIPQEHLDAFKALCDQMVANTENEPKCLYYGFAFNGNQAHCREGYTDAEGVLAHLENVGPLLGEALKISEMTRLEVHGPTEELEKLRGPLAAFQPQYFTLLYGFRR